MKTAVTILLGIDKIILNLKNRDVILITKTVGNKINIIHKGTYCPDTGDIKDILA